MPTPAEITEAVIDAIQSASPRGVVDTQASLAALASAAGAIIASHPSRFKRWWLRWRFKRALSYSVRLHLDLDDAMVVV